MSHSLPQLSREDEALLAEAGLSPEEIERQIELLRSPPPPIRLDRPCRLDDGIVRLGAEDDTRLLPLWETAATDGRFSKFVPASGAASRMFDAAAKARQPQVPTLPALAQQRAAGDPEAAAVLEMLVRLPELPFVEALADTLGQNVDDLAEITTAEQVGTLLDAMLDATGLGFSSLAKGLIPFHRYPDEVRSAFEEHLLEGTHYLAHRGNRSRHHFTVPPTQQLLFERAAAALAARHDLHVDVSFSVQSHSTDTVAIDGTGALVRHRDGRLLLRPGGHGALIGNLEATGGDVVFLKNIDNVTPSTNHAEVARWMQRLGGLLLEIESESHALQERLIAGASAVDDAEAFCRLRLAWTPTERSPEERRAQLLDRLDRPLRVCGMVRNEGEPGGGPFWVTDASGQISAQIVESAQIDSTDDSQTQIWNSSTHFNPVLLVASLCDRNGEPYRLIDFVDPRAVFVSSKTIDGRSARVLEHPGLWNGAMAEWNTVFVELPILTFAPVKTVLDLLRPAHRVGAD